MPLAVLQQKLSSFGLAEGKWKYPKDINAFDDEVIEMFEDYV